jgi:hypothetical protein
MFIFQLKQHIPNTKSLLEPSNGMGLSVFDTKAIASATALSANESQFGHSRRITEFAHSLRLCLLNAVCDALRV